MPRITGNWAALAALASMAAVQLYSPGATADGGGNGPRFNIIYSEDDDGDDDATDVPSGFTSSGQDSLGRLISSLTLFQPLQNAVPQEETAKPLELKGLYAGYSTGLNLNIRPEYRFPEFADNEEPAETSEPKPTYQLWVGYKVMDGLTLNAGLNRDLETLSPEQLTKKHRLSPEGQAMAQAWMEWGRKELARQNARKWLGDDAYNKFRVQFGAADSLDADDLSEWKKTSLYCGGECVAAGF